MAHDIKPNSHYAIVNVQLALANTNGDAIADGLNDLFNPEIGEGFIADYVLLHTDNPAIVTSDEEPVEGELFEQMRTFILHIEDDDYNEEWIKVETSLDLLTMAPDELRRTLEGKVTINDADRISIEQLNVMERVTL